MCILKSKIWHAIGIAALGFLAASPAISQEAKVYRSVAVMDFRFAGISREEMDSYIDRLSLKILETQGFRRVVNRTQREELLRAAGRVRRGGSYEKDQLQFASIIEVDLAVLGEIRISGDGYRLNLWLLDVATGESLYSDHMVYGSTEELVQDCDRLAATLVRSSRQSQIVPEKEKKPREFKAVVGFRLGQEGVTAAPTVEGGSYLYGEVLGEFNRIFGISLKYAAGLFPTYSKNHLITVLSRLNIRLSEELYTAVSIGYMISTDYRTVLRHYIGARVSPIHSGNLGGISIELLPFSLFFDVESWQPVFAIELLSIAFWLPYK
jgi:hypothetical protein